MAPALESTMTQSPSTPIKQPRRPIPITPAIPRSFEKKPKSEKLPPKTGETVTTPLATDDSNDTEAKTTELLGSGYQNEGISHADDKTVHDEILQRRIEKQTFDDQANYHANVPPASTPKSVIGPADHHSPQNRPGDLVNGDITFKLPSNSSPKKSPSISASTEHRTYEDHGDVVQDSLQEPMQSREAVKSPRPPQHHGQPLRATASSFHAHPTPSLDNMASPSDSRPKELSLTESVTALQEQPPTTDATLSPIQTSCNGDVHAHSISFYPPPLSSNDPSSPARSHYQGYAYNPISNGHSLHAHSSSQYSQPYQPHIEAYIPSERPYTQQPPYYDNTPPFPVIGSQAPLTPSTTPLAAVPPPWATPLGHSSLSSNLPVAPVLESPYRSDSYSTSKSDNFPSEGNHTGGAGLQPLQNGMHGTDQLHTSEIDVTYDIPMPTTSDGPQLAEHLLYHFNDPEFADCELILTHEKHRFPKTQWSLSSILLIQSKTLRGLLKSSRPAETTKGGKKVLALSLSDRFVTPTSLDAALRVLYGLPPEAFVNSILGTSTETGAGPPAMMMREALAYAASGNLLSLTDVALHSLRMVSKILSWANVDAALSFALEGGLEKERNASSSVIPPYSTSLPSDSVPSSSSRVIFTPSSSSGPSGQRSDNLSSSPSSPENSRRPPPQSAYELLLYCLDFIVNSFPVSWSLDLAARPCADIDRLPITAESRSPLTKSRLSRIQFGDHPSEAAAKSNDSNVLLSSILLSIPFAQLDHLLRRVGEPLGRNIVSIVREREKRRQIVLQSKSVPWSERVGPRAQEWAEAGYEESVKTSDDGRVELSRKYTGVGRDPADEDHTLQ